MIAEHSAPLGRQRSERSGLGLEQMTKEPGRTPHRLTRIVENVVEPRQPLPEKPREQIHARCVAQVEPEDLQACAELAEVQLLRVTARGIDRESRGDDHVRAGAQQLQRGLVADLHACARDERVVAAKVRGLPALRVVEVATGFAQRIVVAMHFRERPLADVARELVTQLGARVRLLGRRRLEPQRRVDRRASLDAQCGLIDEHSVVRPRRFALGAPERLGHPHELVTLRFRDQARERQQLAALLAREARELRAVCLDGAQHTDASLDVVL